MTMTQTQNQQTEKMDSKSYAVFDRTYMAFGSVMNGLQQRMSTMNQRELDTTINFYWKWAKQRTAELVDEMYARTNKPQEGGPTPL
jgi:hypothetical protein